MDQKIVDKLREMPECRRLERRLPGMFDRIVALDPSLANEFSAWLLRLFFDGRLREEDFYKAPIYLKAVIDHRRALALFAIDSCKDLPALFKVISKFLPVSSRKLSEKYVASLPIETVYESNGLKILVPHSEEAAKYLGRNTQWCTAAEKHNQFEDYNKYGPLMVVQEEGQPRLQLHFSTLSFRDETDEPIDIWELFRRHPALRHMAAWHIEKAHDAVRRLLLAHRPTRALALAAVSAHYGALQCLPAPLAAEIDVRKDWTRVAPDMPAKLQAIALDTLAEDYEYERGVVSGLMRVVIEHSGDPTRFGFLPLSAEEEAELNREISAELGERLGANAAELKKALTAFAQKLGPSIAPAVALRALMLHPTLISQLPQLAIAARRRLDHGTVKNYVDLRWHRNAGADMQRTARELAASTLQKTADMTPQHLAATLENIRSVFATLVKPTAETTRWLAELSKNRPAIMAGKTECIPR